MATTSDNNRRIAKNTLYMYIRMGLTMLVSLYTSRIILQYLGVSDYGIYNVVGSVITAFSFISAPLGTATQRFYSFELGKDNKMQLNVIFNMSFVIYLILALFLVIIIELAGIWFINNKMTLPEDRLDAALFSFHFYTITFVLGLLKVPFDALLIAHEKMGYYARISILEVILKLLNAFSLAYFAVDKLKLFSVNHMVISIVLLLMVAIYSFRHFNYIHFVKTKNIWDKEIFKSLFSFSGWTLFGSVASMTTRQGINILLNTFFGVVVNAAMGIANQVNSAITQFVHNFQVAFRPQIVKYYAEGNLSQLFTLINRTSKLSYMLMFGLICPLWFNFQFVLELWLGQNSVPDFAASFCILMTIYALLESLSAPMWIAIQATGDIRKYQIVISSIMFMNIVLSYIFLKIGLNPTVVLEIKCCLDLLYLAIRLSFIKKMIGFPISSFIKNVISPMLIISTLPIVVLVIISYFVDGQWLQLILSLGVFYAIYIPFVFFVGLTSNERAGIMAMLYAKVKRQ